MQIYDLCAAYHVHLSTVNANSLKTNKLITNLKNTVRENN